MLHQIEAYSKYVEITGFREISFDQADAFLKVHRAQMGKHIELQFFEADLIATQEHLYFAVLNALQAFRYKTNISRSIAVETMLFAAAHRQIKKSIDRIGIRSATKSLAVLVIADDPKHIEAQLNSLSKLFCSDPDDSILQLTTLKREKIKDAFQITSKEIKTQTKGNVNKAIVDLVIEKMALVATQA